MDSTSRENYTGHLTMREIHLTRALDVSSVRIPADLPDPAGILRDGFYLFCEYYCAQDCKGYNYPKYVFVDGVQNSPITSIGAHRKEYLNNWRRKVPS